MTAPARRAARFMSHKAATKASYYAAFNIPAKWRKSAMSRQKMRPYSRRETNVMRVRSADALPGAIAPTLIASRTPARCLAMIVSVNFANSNGSGVAVPQGTVGNLIGNAQSVVFARQCERFPKFRRFGQTQMRARASAYACAYTRGEKQGTREPLGFISINHMFNGSLTGSVVVPMGTGCSNSRAARILSGERNILADGNALQLLDLVADRWSEGQNDGRGSESFGVFGSIWRRSASSSLAFIASSKNSGNLPFSGCSIERVGRGMLEGDAQGADMAGIPVMRCQPDRLDSRGLDDAGALAQAAPLRPHLRHRDPLASCRATVSAFGSKSRAAVLAMSHDPAGCAKVQVDQPGRGAGSLGQAQKGRPGRGKRGCSGWSVGELALRRADHANGRRDRVN